MKVNGFNVKVHKCMDKKRNIVPCANIDTGMEYDRALVGEIIKELPPFVHKHTLYYKMFMTLKLYYLHQQELLNEVLEIIRTHKSSENMLKQLKIYLKNAKGSNYGWIKKINALLDKHMITSKVLSKNSHVIAQLHSIINNAAVGSKGKIDKLFKVMAKKGMLSKKDLAEGTTMKKEASVIMNKVEKVFHSSSSSSSTSTSTSSDTASTRGSAASSASSASASHSVMAHAKASK
jgi:hypothetical protein